MRKNEFENEQIETIYFGGGTPSLLTINELQILLGCIFDNYNVVKNPEITLEANPDDLCEEKIIELSKLPINRLSIGIRKRTELKWKTLKNITFLENTGIW
jgi:oxygen-independent coproporphyrinogen-3 oxidase